MNISKSVQQRVEAGAAFLNVVKPGWLKKIDPEKLNLAKANTCMIGELFGEYHDGIRQIGLSNEVAENLGFYEDGDKTAVGTKRRYRTLTEAWRLKIATLMGKTIS